MTLDNNDGKRKLIEQLTYPVILPFVALMLFLALLAAAEQGGLAVLKTMLDFAQAAASAIAS